MPPARLSRLPPETSICAVLAESDVAESSEDEWILSVSVSVCGKLPSVTLLPPVTSADERDGMVRMAWRFPLGAFEKIVLFLPR